MCKKITLTSLLSVVKLLVWLYNKLYTLLSDIEEMIDRLDDGTVNGSFDIRFLDGMRELSTKLDSSVALLSGLLDDFTVFSNDKASTYVSKHLKR